MSKNRLPILCTIDVDGVKALGFATIPTDEFLTLTELYSLNFDTGSLVMPYVNEEFVGNALSGIYTVSDFVQIIANFNAQDNDQEALDHYVALFKFYDIEWVQEVYEGFSQYFYPGEQIKLTDIPYTIFPMD